MKITSLEICGDYELVINQLLTLYEVKRDDLVSYFQYATQLIEKFEWISLVHIPRKENQVADALTNLAASLTLLKDETVLSLFAKSGYCYYCQYYNKKK